MNGDSIVYHSAQSTLVGPTAIKGGSTLSAEGEEGCDVIGTKFMSYRTISPEPICQRAWVVGKEGLHFVDDAPMPDVSDKDVLIRIKAVALGHHDLYLVRWVCFSDIRIQPTIL